MSQFRVESFGNSLVGVGEAGCEVIGIAPSDRATNTILERRLFVVLKLGCLFFEAQNLKSRPVKSEDRFASVAFDAARQTRCTNC